MYDFWLGTREEIERDELRFLISVKRMMPRWTNSMPDSEFAAVAQLLDDQGQRAREAGRKPVFVETGAGASTIAQTYYAMKHDGRALSWDTNGEKGSLIRTVCTETLGNAFERRVDDHWQLAAFASLSPHLGLPILPELVDHVDFFMHDSEHTWRTIEGELRAVAPMLSDESVVALDDANLGYAHTNMGYVNTFRRKLGLPAAEDPHDNTCEPFYVLTERLLSEHFEQVELLPDLYKERYAQDPYFAYFNAEFEINKSLGTVEATDIDHRFDSWRVSGRKA